MPVPQVLCGRPGEVRQKQFQVEEATHAPECGLSQSELKQRPPDEDLGEETGIYPRAQPRQPPEASQDHFREAKFSLTS